MYLKWFGNIFLILLLSVILFTKIMMGQTALIESQHNLTNSMIVANSQASQSTTITVNTTDDEINSDGDCSLREAIQAANTDAPIDGCPAGCGDDLIIVPAGVYNLNIPGRVENLNQTGDFDITSNLIVKGESAVTTVIDASELDRAFHIINGTVTISDLTITNGETFRGNSGGIQNEGTLTVTNCMISNNSGGDGGGIQNMLTLTVINSTVSYNVSDIGGGIGNSGGETITIINSTINNNVATEFGGGLSNLGTKSTLINSTISGNIANEAGGGIENLGILELIYCTITENEAPMGGGIVLWGVQETLFKNTIIAGNFSGGDCNGIVTSSEYSLDSDGSCVSTGVDGNITSSVLGIGPLEDNGGQTETHALLSDSPAIDAGNCDATILIDQRGVPRPQGTICDIGAFELSTAKFLDF